MGTIRVFNLLKNLSRDYVLVKGNNVIRINNDGEYYFDEEWDETNIFPMTSFGMDSFIEAFNSLDDFSEIKSAGVYNFEALLEYTHPEYDIHSNECFVEHIVWERMCTIEEYDSDAIETNNNGDLPF